MASELKVGDRVRLSREGRRVNAQSAALDSLGSITGKATWGDGFIVKWESLKTKWSLHKDFLELAEPATPPTPNNPRG